MESLIAAIGQIDVVFYGVLILLAFFLLVAVFFFSSWIVRHERALSPYTGMPLRIGSELPYDSKRRILQFLYEKHEYDNRIFELSRSAVCRDTGRVFPNCITWLGTMKVNWTFLQKRFPGQYVSWGSLNDTQQGAIREAHGSLEGFQTEASSKNPAPSEIEPEFAFAKPGPLYVDINTKIVLGWQCVPDTMFEVLIVQKPRKR